MINSIAKEIMKSNNIVITFHTSPDGDSLGSANALYLGIKSLGKKCEILSKEKVKEPFSYLSSISNEMEKEKSIPSNEVDLVIVLDCGDVKRINADLDFINRKYKIINIDHHMSNEKYGDFNYVDTTAAAVGEIIYKLLKELKVDITKEMAESMYTSILTDTGSFRHSNTTKITHNIAGDIIDTGINFSEIHRKVFDNKTFEKIKFYGKVIDTMTLECNGNAVFMEITKNMIEELNLQNEDTGDVLTFGNKVNSSDVTVLLKEADEGTKVSLRSKEKVDVRSIAEKFNGGGHIRAAGFLVKDDIKEIKEKLISILKEELM